MVLTSRSNPVVKYLTSLQEKKFRLQSGEYLVEGEKPVREALECKLPVSAVYLSQSLYEKGNFPNVSIPVYVLSDDLFSKVSTMETPQGAIATVKLPSLSPVAPTGSCLLLDGVADPGNMGTIIRTANAAGYKQIYLLGCCDPFSPKVVRASMSGVFHTSLYEVKVEELASLLQGVSVIVADLNGENIFTFAPPEKFCLCIGNEGHGLREETKALANYTITIPMDRTQESLNAGVSAGIAMYLLRRKYLM